MKPSLSGDIEPGGLFSFEAEKMGKFGMNFIKFKNLFIALSCHYCIINITTKRGVKQ